eukprot:IDg20866t1
MSRACHIARLVRVPRIRTIRTSSTWAQALAAEHTPPVLIAHDKEEEEASKPIHAWTSAGIDARVANALVCAGFASPTEVQRLAARPVQTAEATLIAAETGGGKTFAYLAPVLSALRAGEAKASQTARRPRALVLAPTRELVAQVRLAATSISRGLAAVRAHTGGPLRGAQQRVLGESACDVLVTTPAALARLRRDRAVFLSHVRHAVLDEADVLL